MRLCVTVAVATLAFGCSFDTSGVPSEVARDASGGPDAVGGTGVDAAVGDGGGPDAQPVACLDRDGDQFQTVGIPGSECGALLDCDDLDPSAYPGQPDYFDVPRVSGGFDYDCDGTEAQLDTSEGSRCGWDWWDCVGTGWTAGVPACGQSGAYHVCRDQGGCNEVSAGITLMQCN